MNAISSSLMRDIAMEQFCVTIASFELSAFSQGLSLEVQLVRYGFRFINIRTKKFFLISGKKMLSFKSLESRDAIQS